MQPERRKHVRILTIRNFGWAMLALVVALAAANVISEMRKPRPGEFGRLTLDSQPVALQRPQAVKEDEVPDVTPTMPAASLVSEAPAAALPTPAKVPAADGGATQNHVTIVGGADGIQVVTSRKDATPKLSGGIFRIEN
jgi:hypothetical protein